METKEYRHTDVDKLAEFGPGPWVDEPDKVQWLDEASGLPCVVKRNTMGVWCGYVGVPQAHPAASAGGIFDSVFEVLDVHGGVTYGPSPCSPHDDSELGEAHAICHIVQDGEDDNVMWIGFDCGHGGQDYVPVMDRELRRQGNQLSEESMRRMGGHLDSYKPVQYARSECERLAAQLAEMAA